MKFIKKIWNSNNTLDQLIRYGFVGGIAFIVDWGSLLILYKTGINIYVAIVIAFVIGLITNFKLSKLLVFKKNSSKTNIFGEFIVYAIIGIAGLLITELLMWLFIEKIEVIYYIAKIIAAIIVLLWNFVARKIILY